MTRAYHGKPCPQNPELCACRVCWLFLHDEAANRAWGGTGVDQERRRLSIRRGKEPCFFLGIQVEDPASCGCGQAVAHECQLFGRCRRVGPSLNGESICLNCPSHVGESVWPV